MATAQHDILLGDAFSLDGSGFFGRAVANRSLLKAITTAQSVKRVITTLPAAAFADQPGLPVEKIVSCASLSQLIDNIRANPPAAIFCSDFVATYPDWIDFRNRQGLDCPVYGWTHSLSYQRYTADIMRILNAGPRPENGILCTSPSAVAVVGKLLDSARSTLRQTLSGPGCYLFPLPFESQPSQARQKITGDKLQVLTLGRLDWQTKAGLLVLEPLIRQLKNPEKFKFVIAGGGDNRSYITLLQRILGPLGVEIKVDISDEDKSHLYQTSQVLFMPVDNYQETFGLVIPEAQSHGCVPLVSDFDGFRSLVKHGENGLLLPTYAAKIPDQLKIISAMPLSIRLMGNAWM